MREVALTVDIGMSEEAALTAHSHFTISVLINLCSKTETVSGVYLWSSLNSPHTGQRSCKLSMDFVLLNSS